MIELAILWPPRALHPNDRGHWSKRAKESKRARAFAFYKAKEAKWSVGGMDGRLHLWIDFYPPDRRKRDDDGLLASFKPFRDGIADALGIDDNRFISHPYVKDEVIKGGLVKVRITGGP